MNELDLPAELTVILYCQTTFVFLLIESPLYETKHSVAVI